MTTIGMHYEVIPGKELDFKNGFNGVLGVMNTMFAAVTQRRKDIAMLRILGFARWQVLFSFLVEALLLSLIGGSLGCALGTLANGCEGFIQNAGLAYTAQTSNADSGRCGQQWNGEAYGGISNPAYGRLTIGRQNSLQLDNLASKQPERPVGVAFRRRSKARGDDFRLLLSVE